MDAFELLLAAVFAAVCTVKMFLLFFGRTPPRSRSERGGAVYGTAISSALFFSAAVILALSVSEGFGLCMRASMWSGRKAMHGAPHTAVCHAAPSPDNNNSSKNTYSLEAGSRCFPSFMGMDARPLFAAALFTIDDTPGNGGIYVTTPTGAALPGGGAGAPGPTTTPKPIQYDSNGEDISTGVGADTLVPPGVYRTVWSRTMLSGQRVVASGCVFTTNADVRVGGMNIMITRLIADAVNRVVLVVENSTFITSVLRVTISNAVDFFGNDLANAAHISQRPTHTNVLISLCNNTFRNLRPESVLVSISASAFVEGLRLINNGLYGYASYVSPHLVGTADAASVMVRLDLDPTASLSQPNVTLQNIYTNGTCAFALLAPGKKVNASVPISLQGQESTPPQGSGEGGGGFVSGRRFDVAAVGPLFELSEPLLVGAWVLVINTVSAPIGFVYGGPSPSSSTALTPAVVLIRINRSVFDSAFLLRSLCTAAPYDGGGLPKLNITPPDGGVAFGVCEARAVFAYGERAADEGEGSVGAPVVYLFANALEPLVKMLSDIDPYARTGRVASVEIAACDEAVPEAEGQLSPTFGRLPTNVRNNTFSFANLTGGAQCSASAYFSVASRLTAPTETMSAPLPPSLLFAGNTVRAKHVSIFGYDNRTTAMGGAAVNISLATATVRGPPPSSLPTGGGTAYTSNSFGVVNAYAMGRPNHAAALAVFVADADTTTWDAPTYMSGAAASAPLGVGMMSPTAFAGNAVSVCTVLCKRTDQCVALQFAGYTDGTVVTVADVAWPFESVSVPNSNLAASQFITITLASAFVNGSIAVTNASSFAYWASMVAVTTLAGSLGQGTAISLTNSRATMTNNVRGLALAIAERASFTRSSVRVDSVSLSGMYATPLSVTPASQGVVITDVSITATNLYRSGYYHYLVNCALYGATLARINITVANGTGVGFASAGVVIGFTRLCLRRELTSPTLRFRSSCPIRGPSQPLTTASKFCSAHPLTMRSLPFVTLRRPLTVYNCNSLVLHNSASYQ